MPRFLLNDNDLSDYEEEDGEYRRRRRMNRAMINNDRDYPDALHEQDILDQFGIEEDIYD